jgi:hypothetical protein
MRRFYAQCMAPQRPSQPAVTNTLGTNTGYAVQAGNIDQINFYGVNFYGVNFYGPPIRPLATSRKPYACSTAIDPTRPGR